MKIERIEDNIERISNLDHKSIIELIIDAIRTFPKYIDESNEYFEEIKSLLKTDEITVDNLKSYLIRNNSFGNEKDVWIIDSLNSLLESFKLMQLYEIEFKDVLKKIDSI